MLILSRKVGASIVIETKDGPVKIMVVSIRGGHVRLGFEAPDVVEIWREELLPLDPSAAAEVLAPKG